ncbi:MAG: hypothetical protein J6I84_07035 [Bacilli bacterium]|nr:hypothetical protein [Bacilli bacterium]
MTKTSKVMLVFACIFVTLAFTLFAFQAYVELCSMGLLFGGDNTFGDAIGGIFIFIYSIMLGIAAIVAGVVSLPFEIVLLKGVGKKWYSLTLLIVSIATIVSAVVFFFLLPAVSEAINNATSSSSSIPSTSSY